MVALCVRNQREPASGDPFPTGIAELAGPGECLFELGGGRLDIPSGESAATPGLGASITAVAVIA